MKARPRALMNHQGLVVGGRSRGVRVGADPLHSPICGAATKSPLNLDELTNEKERHLPLPAGAGLRRVLSEGRLAVPHSGTSVRRSPLRILQGLFQKPARRRRANARSVQDNHPARRGPKGRKPTTPDENVALKNQVGLPQFDLSVGTSGCFSLRLRAVTTSPGGYGADVRPRLTIPDSLDNSTQA